MTTEEAVAMARREATRREAAAAAEGGSGKPPSRLSLPTRRTSELWDEIRNLRQEQRDFRTAIDLRDAKTEAAMERMRSDTREEIKSLGTSLEAAVCGAVDQLRTEFKEGIGRFRTESKDDFKAVRQEIGQLRTETREDFKTLHQEVTGLTRWAITTIVTSLQQIARIQSTASSNRIEGIQVPSKKLKELLLGKTAPRNRSEAEISGYRDVLATLHTSVNDIPVKPRIILQLHRDMYRYLPNKGGAWKPAQNVIQDTMSDGAKRVRFVPVEPFLVPSAMDELCEALNNTWGQGDIDNVLLTFLFVLDFLCIHPFADGNGRMSRLLTLLLLYHAGFEVGRFISLERIIEESKETYYGALEKSSRGWHKREHNPIPWIEYSLGVLLAAYKKFEEMVNEVQNQKGAKGALIADAISRFAGGFTIRDIERACPNVSRPTIYNVLSSLKEDGIVECLVPGRSARWKRV